MKKGTTLIVFVLAFIWQVQGMTGGGTSIDPYLISNYADLKLIKNNRAAHYRLAGNIDASASATENSGAGFEPIGASATPFTGKLHGGGFVIHKLTIKRNTLDYVGLFGYMGSGSAVDSLGLVNVNIIGKNYVGGMIGANYGTITNSFVTGLVSSSGSEAGGLVGINSGTIFSCFASADVNATNKVGGLVGTGNGGAISNSYATSSVNGSQNVGGLIGFQLSGFVSNCYAAGQVTGSSLTGGLVGSNSGIITASYWDIEASGQTASAAGAGKTSAEMKTQITFIGWDFSSFWNVVGNSSYPGLRTTKNAPFAFRESLVSGYKINLSKVLVNDYDIETGTTNLTFKVISHSEGSINNGVLTFPESLPLETTSTLVYRVGEVMGTDTLWGNVATSIITLSVRGYGTDEAPYIITSYDDLKKMASISLSGSYQLGNNIDATASATDNGGAGFEPIGIFSSTPFRGKLLGEGYEIQNLKINRGGQNFVGLFGYLGSGGVIDSLKLISANILGKGYVGALVGLSDGSITNCFSSGTVRGNADYTGGLVGDNYYNSGTITSCFSTCTVTGTISVGGLVGYNNKIITNSGASGVVNGNNDNVGGLVGYNDTSGNISFSFATGRVNVTGSSFYAGGFVGYNKGSISNCYATGTVNADRNWYVGGFGGENRGTVSNCYATGWVSSTGALVGGFVGYKYYNATVSNCFWNTATSGRSTSDSGAGKISSQMVQQATFSGWDFSTNWTINEGTTFPYLKNNIPAVLPAPPTITIGGSFTVNSKMYDGTTDATINTNELTRVGVNGSDVVTLNAVASFVDAEAGLGKSVVLTKSTLSGTHSAKYILLFNDAPVATANITKKVSIGGTFTVNDKPYDGTTAATINSNELTLTGVDSEDLIELNAVAAFADALVENNKTVSLSGSSLTGDNASLYTLWLEDAPTAVASIIKVDAMAPGIPIVSEKTNVSIMLLSDELLEFSKDGETWQESPVFDGLEPATTYTFTARTKETATHNASQPSEALQVSTRLNGNGTAADPYLITSYNELKLVKEDLSAHYRLENNIDASTSATENEGAGFEPIGKDWFNSFTGGFQGGGFYIKNLTINAAEDEMAGLFGRIEGALIDGVGLLDANIAGSAQVGGLVAVNSFGVVAGSYVTGLVNGTGSQTGGLVGLNYGEISNSYSTASVSGVNSAGGLVGLVDGGNVTNCYASGTVSGLGVSAGLVGINQNGNITSCYAVGKVISDTDAHGLVAMNMGTVTTSYWNIETTNQNSPIGETGLTTNQMKVQLTFNEWDFVNTWNIIDNKSYPGLRGVNNAPFAFKDELTSNLNFTLSELLLNDYDVETGTANLVLDVISHADGTISDGVFTFPEGTELGTIVTIVYRVGEVLGTDTLWGNTAASTVTYTATTFLQDISGLMDIKAYPNPTTDKLYIETKDNEVPVVTLYNLQGIVLLQLKTNCIDMSVYPMGTYLVDINGKRMKVIKR